MPGATGIRPHDPPRRVSARRTVDHARLVVLVPAHDEEDALPGALRALRRQTVRPAAVTVVADRCTDGTAAVARSFGARVLPTRDNDDRKAGALNQALAALAVAPPEYVLVLDAGTRVARTFVETALAHLDSDPSLGAVSGMLHGAVVSGTPSMFRYRALADVADHRGAALPGSPGDVYDRAAIVGDAELALALRRRGWRLVAPAHCRCSTEPTPTPAPRLSGHLAASGAGR